MKNAMVVAAVNREGKVATAFLCQRTWELCMHFTNCITAPGEEHIEYVFLAKASNTCAILPRSELIDICQWAVDHPDDSYLLTDHYRIDL